MTHAYQRTRIEWWAGSLKSPFRVETKCAKCGGAYGIFKQPQSARIAWYLPESSVQTSSAKSMNNEIGDKQLFSEGSLRTTFSHRFEASCECVGKVLLLIWFCHAFDDDPRRQFCKFTAFKLFTDFNVASTNPWTSLRFDSVHRFSPHRARWQIQFNKFRRKNHSDSHSIPTCVWVCNAKRSRNQSDILCLLCRLPVRSEADDAVDAS